VRVLLSAYACRPNVGSEPGVGFATLLAVADHHEVWVLTREKNVDPIKRFLKGHTLESRIHVIGLDLGLWAMSVKKRLGSAGFQWYYDRWQRKAGLCGAALLKKIPFDVVHHVTFASDWARAGVADLGPPFVWGPVGGRIGPPLRLLTTLGTRGIVAEMFRMVGRALMRQRGWYRRTWKRAGVVLAQNAAIDCKSPYPHKTRRLPNSTAMLSEAVSSATRRGSEIFVVGRIVPWKGGVLAIRALKAVENPDAILRFVGDGPDTPRLRRLVSELGLSTRVTFEGSLPRSETLVRLAHASALLHPAMHDESPLAVGEALSMGTPVICLDWGGPPELLRRWPDSPSTAVPVSSVAATVQGLAQAIDHYLSDRAPTLSVAKHPWPPYASEIIAAYDLAVGDPRS
jgi:glycosyltransferase involved in cell wall biosynthesis